MKRRLTVFLTGLFIILMFLPTVSGDDPVYLYRNVGSFTSVATNDDVSALIVNPAGLGFKRRFEGYFSFTTRSDPEYLVEKNLYLLRLPIVGSIGFEEYLNDNLESNKVRVINWGGTVLKLNNLSFGFNKRWYYSDFGTVQSVQNYDLGMMYRPYNWISIGAVMRNYCADRDFLDGELQRRLRGGVALRPFTNRITLSWDTEYEEFAKDKFRIWDNYYGVKLEILPLTYIYASGNKDADINFGISIYSGFSSFSYSRTENEDQTMNYDNLVFTFDSLYHKKEFQGIPSKFKPTMVARVVIAGSFSEEEVRGNFLTPRVPKFRDLVSQFEKVLYIEEVSGVVVHLKDNNLSIAQVQELISVMEKIQEWDKFIIFYLEYGAGLKNYYLATVGDAIMMPPSATLELFGLSSRMTFFKGLFNKVGIEADYIRPDSNKYKSAVEQFTRDSISPEAEENLRSLLGDIFDQITEGIAIGREKEKSEVQNIIDTTGIIDAKKALELDLIDKIGYESDIKDLVNDYMGFFRLPEKMSSINLEYLDFYNDNWSNKAEIAVMFITGTITTGESGSNLLFGQTAGSETIAKKLDMLAGRKDIKAVVIRVDSPGGSALASDLIWQKIEMLKKSGKKVIISMGNVAASGGYYVAAPGDIIVADPGTITGSIGIFGGKFVLKELYGKLGITQSQVKFGKYSDMYAMNRTFTDEERQMLKDHMGDFYLEFKTKVGDGRNLTLDRVEEIARGQVYTGRQALEINLVDEIGTLQDAIKIAAREAKIKKINNILYMDMRGNVMNELFTGGNVRKFFIPDLGIELIDSENYWYICPYSLETR
ncbi:MAG: signal peptide peptidase SppA [bacterium]|nr:signal peptide peptidase SppA [bacterium]